MEIHSDGSMRFLNEGDRAAEKRVMQTISQTWNVTVQDQGALAPIDCQLLRHQRLKAMGEIRCRDNTYAKFPTVYLNVDKYLSMCVSEVLLGKPSLWFVEFTDGLYWVKAMSIDGRAQGWCKRHNPEEGKDEVVIEVPTSILKPVTYLETTRQ